MLQNKSPKRKSQQKQNSPLLTTKLFAFIKSPNFLAVIALIYAISISTLLVLDHLRPLPDQTEIKYYAPTVEESAQTPIVETPPVDPLQLRIDEIISQMDTRQKVGQLFMFGFNGTTPDANIVRFLRENYVGSVILMKYNFASEAQTKQLTQNLQIIANEAGHQIPIFIGVDQEGGVVNRVLFLENDLYLAQNQLSTKEQAYELANRRGKALNALGINMVFAPVVDLVDNSGSFIYARTFRDYPKQGYTQSVVEFGNAMVQGFIDSNMIPVPKHFPGYTNEISDPHNSIPVSSATIETLLSTTLPYKALIVNHDNSHFVIMSTPINYPNIDPSALSLFSPKILDELLRGTLGFTGIIITDDLRMAALNKYTVEESAVNSINGGNDIAMYTTNWQIQERAYNAVLGAVNSGQISEEMLNSSVRRIIEAKLGLEE